MLIGLLNIQCILLSHKVGVLHEPFIKSNVTINDCEYRNVKNCVHCDSFFENRYSNKRNKKNII